MTDPRLQTMQQLIQQADLDAIALIPGANLQYLTGIEFHLMERPLVAFFLPDHDPVAVVPALEQDRLRVSGLPFVVFPWSDSEGYQGAFEAAASQLTSPGSASAWKNCGCACSKRSSSAATCGTCSWC